MASDHDRRSPLPLMHGPSTLEEANFVLIRAELVRMRDRISALEAEAQALHRKVEAETAALHRKYEHLAGLLAAHLKENTS